jgi:SET domain-containing protein
MNFESPDCEKVVFKLSPIHGTGGFARVTIHAGARIIEYVGQKISKAESLRRCEQENQYIFALDDQFDLDGNAPANPARFLNHSCAPNCEAEVDGGRIWIVALREIAAGEELTYNYNYDLVDYREHPCRCGAADCVGYIVAGEFFDQVRRQRDLRAAAVAGLPTAPVGGEKDGPEKQTGLIQG